MDLHAKTCKLSRMVKIICAVFVVSTVGYLAYRYVQSNQKYTITISAEKSELPLFVVLMQETMEDYKRDLQQDRLARDYASSIQVHANSCRTAYQKALLNNPKKEDKALIETMIKIADELSTKADELSTKANKYITENPEDRMDRMRIDPDAFYKKMKRFSMI